jgi:hypothetical protein
MTLRSESLMDTRARWLGSVPWNQDGCHRIAVQVGDDVPALDHGMIRRALVRGSLVCESVTDLSRAINRNLWEIGYFAKVKSDRYDDGSVVVEVSNPLIPPRLF